MPQGEVFLLLVFNGFLGQRNTILSFSLFSPFDTLMAKIRSAAPVFVFIVLCVCGKNT